MLHRRLGLTAVAIVAGLCLAESSSLAHFQLQSPPANAVQNELGDPQKAPPCGDNGTGVPTGTVTTFQAGQQITITINETIFHPGHYRIALAENDPSELPAEPIVTAGSTDCGSTTIMDPPVYPVLADGVFLHDTEFTEPQSIAITLPDDVTCDHCTLQIIQFMSNHGLNNPGGCFYHHCADIALQEEPVMTTSSTTTTTSGGPGAGGGGSGSGPSGTGGAKGFVDPIEDEGCTCGVPGSAGGSWAPLAFVAALAVAASRRRATVG